MQSVGLNDLFIGALTENNQVGEGPQVIDQSVDGEINKSFMEILSNMQDPKEALKTPVKNEKNIDPQLIKTLGENLQVADTTDDKQSITGPKAQNLDQSKTTQLKMIDPKESEKLNQLLLESNKKIVKQVVNAKKPEAQVPLLKGNKTIDVANNDKVKLDSVSVVKVDTKQLIGKNSQEGKTEATTKVQTAPKIAQEVATKEQTKPALAKEEANVSDIKIAGAKIKNQKKVADPSAKVLLFKTNKNETIANQGPRKLNKVGPSKDMGGRKSQVKQELPAELIAQKAQANERSSIFKLPSDAKQTASQVENPYVKKDMFKKAKQMQKNPDAISLLKKFNKKAPTKATTKVAGIKRNKRPVNLMDIMKNAKNSKLVMSENIESKVKESVNTTNGRSNVVNFAAAIKQQTDTPIKSEAFAPTKVLDLSSVGQLNRNEMISRVSKFIEQNNIENSDAIDLIVKHDDLGHIKINVTKHNINNLVDIEITTTSKEGAVFFRENNGELLNSLANTGVKVSDLKLTSATNVLDFSDSFKNSSKQQNENSQFMEKEAGHFQNKNDFHQDADSRRRNAMWEYYKEKMGA
ncbi:MAG: hypothetical protein ISR65_06015 [Bacteriovoracaceae bacterium]|nr:hypothetical protein [Bacteriovoracaceae bacterium]